MPSNRNPANLNRINFFNHLKSLTMDVCYIWEVYEKSKLKRKAKTDAALDFSRDQIRITIRDCRDTLEKMRSDLEY